MRFRVNLTLEKGAQQLRERLANALRAAPALVGAELYREGEAIKAAALPITPIQYGALRRSLFVAKPVISGTQASVTVGAGGDAAPYALYVHETPPRGGGAWHTMGEAGAAPRTANHAPPTQWKFIEVPMNAALPGMADRIAAALAPRLGFR